MKARLAGPPRQARYALLTLALLFALASPALAHNLALGKAAFHIGADGAFEGLLEFDVVAWVMGLDPAGLTLTDVERLAGRSPARLQLDLDEASAMLERDCTFIPAAASQFEFPSEPRLRAALEAAMSASTLPAHLEVKVAGRLPPGDHAYAFAVRFPPRLGAFLLTVRAGDRAPCEALVLPGEASPPCPVSAAAPAVTMNPRQAAMRYLALGFTHILPKGLDHILFVLGLFLLSPKLKPLLWQVTAFTVAHSLTLALSLYGVFSLPSRLVEPLIAASIAFVAVENLLTTRLHPWRPLVVFAFGLVHGLGFAGVLTELGLPRQHFGLALLAFNGGVELGQLAVLALAAAVFGWFFGKSWYRARIVVPASCAIAAVGAYWTLVRLAG